MKYFGPILLAAAAAASGGVDGFELVTHAALTQSAYERFMRDGPAKLAEFGVLSLSNDPQRPPIFGNVYYDVSVSPGLRQILPRHDWLFEGRMINRLGEDPLSIVGWLMRGAIREDDGLAPIDDNPQDDTYPTATWRYAHHFFDPVHNRPLIGVPCCVVPERAPDWATGATDAFINPNTKQTGRANHFTVFDAQEAMFNALTLKKIDDQGQLVDLAIASDPNSRQAAQKAYWATTFRALGDIMHLIQDMGQPQHARNDPHSGAFQIGLGHKSFFEQYLDARAQPEQNSFTIKDVLSSRTVVAITPLPLHLPKCDATGQNCGDYPLPSPLVSVFKQYSDFWSTTPGAIGGKGLADYSNAGFFSAGTNIGMPGNDYASPPNNPSSQYYVINSTTPTSWDGSPLNGPPIYFYQRDVQDSLNPGQRAQRVPLTSYSVWDDFMETRNILPAYHLVRANYDAQEMLLIPRAVAYSAGLLEYFFRGTLEIDLPPEGAYAVVDHYAQRCIDACGFRKVNLTPTNKTPVPQGGTPGQDMTSGRLVAVAKFHRNTCYKEDLTGDAEEPSFRGLSCRSPAEEVVVSNPVPLASLPGGVLATQTPQLVSFTFQTPIPINASDLYLQVVFRGALGAEQDAVVVTTKDISEPNYFAFTNVSDYYYDYAVHYYRPLVSGQLSNVDSGVSVYLGSATNAIATLSVVTAPQQAQLAYLTDVGMQTLRIQSVQANFNPEWGIGENEHVAEFKFNPGSGHYTRNVELTESRGVVRDLMVFDTLPMASQHPFPPCSTEPELCNQTTMAPFPPGSIIQWTINPSFLPN